MKKKDIVTISLFVIAIMMILIGVHVEEPAEVFQKAVNICLECIGVG